MKTQHTQTPWHAEGINIWQSDDDNTIPIAYVDTEASQAENKANAAFIVRCVNSHDGLLELLTEAKKMLKERSYTWQEIDEFCARIDKAKGEA